MAKNKLIKGASKPKINKVIPAKCSSCPFIHQQIKPSWRLSDITEDGRFSFPDNVQELKAIFSKLRQLERLTIQELMQGQNNLYAVYNLSKVADKLDKEVKDKLQRDYSDFDCIHRFRLNAKCRVYALSTERGIFNLIWYDKEHEIYKLDKS